MIKWNIRRKRKLWRRWEKERKGERERKGRSRRKLDKTKESRGEINMRAKKLLL